MKKNGINLAFANILSPKPTLNWKRITENEKYDLIKEKISEIDPLWSEKFNIISAKNNGFLIFEFKRSIPVDERANYLLGLENELCTKIDNSITIWMAPVGDKSSLRNLRGIKVKSN